MSEIGDITVAGVDGRTFNVRIVREGDAYGRNGAITHDEAEPLVEFYDASRVDITFGDWGLFVSRYYITTLLEGDCRGLGLEGSVPEWSIGGEEFSALRVILGREQA